VTEDAGVVATRVFKCVGQPRHEIKGPSFVDLFGKGDHAGRPPCRIEGHGTEGVAEEVSEEVALGSGFGLPGGESAACAIGEFS
jgi:hypothetical protein